MNRRVGFFYIEATDFVVGDVYHDGMLTVSDVSLLVSHILGSGSDGINTEQADVNGDGIFTIADVQSLVGRLLTGQ